MDHFEGKPVAQHLKEARKKGHLAASEAHGTEMPGFFSACLHAMKDTSSALLLLWTLGLFLPLSSMALMRIYVLFSIGWLIWKIGKSCLLGWARLERMHRMIEEERNEIERNRPTERKELTELYQAKGLTGKLLEDVVDVLMADDRRLLQIMLEEELGLSLESEIHPLQQGIGAGCGVVSASLLGCLGAWILPSFGLPLFSACMLFFSALFCAKRERNQALPLAIWHLCLAGLSMGLLFYVARILYGP